MKRNLLYILLAGVLTQTACQKDFLDKSPTDGYTNETLWTTEAAAAAALAGCYKDWETSTNIFYMDAVSDNSYSQWAWDNYQHLGNGTATATDPQVVSQWDYVTIQKCNWFIENVGKAPIADDIKTRFTAEARFLRAYRYFLLTQLYGNVPLVVKNLSTTEAGTVTKTPKAEVRKFITDELAAIAQVLPDKYTGNDIGRITKGAALSLRARVELYDKNYAAAIEDCKKVMALGYGLFPNYTDLFRPDNENNKEVILDIQYKANEKDNENENIGILPSSGYGGWASLSPTQSLVDAYEMANGKTIDDPASGYNENDPYTGRDPRLAANVVYPGLQYSGKIYDPITPGSDNYYSEGNNSPTGYLVRKFAPFLSDFPDMWHTGLNIIVIRYAEVLLTYAEAQVESGVIDNSVYQALDDIRQRAGMPLVDRAVYNDVTSLRKLIRRERRVELALEGLRWYDIQRWQIGADVRSGAVYGTRLGTVDATTGKVTLTGDHIVTERRVFNPQRDYLWPVPQKEIDINKGLGQNPGY
ncbi:RagB/SusD family nutrient uptake outer membrane protein [Chitinophaga qingshengii]|uniref:RagB/SusD family nutrient uptake outer membrane protein n=1 Tax=Chitinophaga qingshengii TaxID=1569794 RepID=A0ABR7TPF7_9BACT|nr:RagB/SusD family nutrient uptake outer membrane protein [Chitinophaga qingshengii]MBC9932359.1 RagB/SusD family nutrient uptake outer membrane protein [Chitinophaga qingshengii]